MRLTPKHKAFLLIAPAFIYMGFFIAYPLSEAIYLSFFEEGALSLANIRYLVGSPLSKFTEAFRYTLTITAIVIPIETALALLIALFLYNSFKGRDLILYMVIIPLTISDVAAGLIWYSILTSNGFMNNLLISLGLIDQPIQVFGSEFKVRMLLAIVVTEVWRSMAIVFVILFAGLQLLSRDLIEAAEVFGASWMQKLTKIILPMLKPSLQSALIIRTLFAFQIFGVVWILAGRNIPVLAGEAYYELTELRHEGVAALYALIIAAISLSFGFIYIRTLRARHLEVTL
ncbi:MAG: sugar ABC transporter permease [Desulfurococcales archaeon]|nr:sugar ABC transporter permease [Desulfurococcales archaeon]